jgi:hypothetical protein
MSGILFTAPFLAILTSIATFVVARIFAARFDRTRQSKYFGYGVSLLMFPIACIFFFSWLPRFTTQSGHNVSAHLANEHLGTFDIPASATNVDYRHSHFDGLIDAADFNIAESDFMNWMAGNHWAPIAFSTVGVRIQWADGQDHRDLEPPVVTPVSFMLDGRHEEVRIDNGFYFDDYDPRGNDDSGLTVVYDSDKERAYVCRTVY